MDNTQLWEFIHTYFRDHPQHLVQHHIESYNHFFQKDIYRIFRENNPQTLHSDVWDETHQDYAHSLKMYYGGKDGTRLYFGKPVISDEDRPHIMMPNEARLRDMNYSMTIHYDVEIEYTRYITTEQQKEIEQRRVVGGGYEEDSKLLHQQVYDPLENATRKAQFKDQLLTNVQLQNNVDEYLQKGGDFQIDKHVERVLGGQSEKQGGAPPLPVQQRTIAYKTTFRLEKIYLGSFPIMVQSAFCLLTGMNKEMRSSLGECLSDVGGYFIIGGKEKVIVPQEKFGNNMLRIQASNDDKFDWSADILSVSENISKPIRGLSVKKYAQSGQIVVALPNVRAPVPLFIVFRALGIITDRDIIQMCVLDMEQYAEFLPNFRPSIHDAGPIFTQRDALQYIALLTKWKQIHTAQLILADYFLPHIGETNYLQKAYYLGYMVMRLLRVYRKLDDPTDRDHFKYKRLELPGTLISDLFREYYTSQIHKLHTAFESQLYFKRGQYGTQLDRLVLDTHQPIFQNIREVNQGFKKAFKGNWGGQPHTKRIGVVQDMNRLSSNSALDHLRKTNLPIDPSMAKVVALRTLHSSQWGLFDPIDTPDGGNIGLHKHLSIMTHVTRQMSREPIIQWMRQKLSQFYLLADVRPTLLSKMSKIFVNGYWLGATVDPITCIQKMLLHRRNGLLPVYTSVSFDYRENAMYIHTDGGRLCRPIFYWDEDTHSFSSERIPSLFSSNTSNPKGSPESPSDALDSASSSAKYSEFTWTQVVSGFNTKKKVYDPSEDRMYELNELYELTPTEAKELSENTNHTPERFVKNKAIIEYIDNMESQYALISLDHPTSSAHLSHNHSQTQSQSQSQNKKRDKTELRWTHQEIHPSLNHGMMCNLIIFLENNPASRNNFSCTQSKQAVSMYHTQYQTRMDKSAVILNTGQIPLMKTRFMEAINGENNPYGVNAIVAIMCHTGYNVEDATLVNEGALQRGLFKTTYHTTYTAHEETNVTPSSHVTIRFAQSSQVTNLIGTKPGFDYSHLDENGLIKEGTEVDDKTVLIGLVTRDLTPGSTDTLPHDSSVVPKKGQLGIVDKVFITEGEEGQRIAKVRIRETRIPAVGDKLASRAGQKGTIGMIVPEANMPFTAQGIRPDIIINPHAIPTRMTIGHLVECISGKACAQMGGYGDCTAYNNEGSKIQVFGEILTKFGYHSAGNEVLYDGHTGQQIEASIFMGPNYYMRLKQMVKDKINHRALGPNTALTRQPVSGRANDGGLRIGEMERDAVYAHGISYFLQESMLDRGDHIYLAICNQTGMVAIYNPERNIMFSPMADGPVRFTGSVETGDFKIDAVSKYGRSFSVVKIPYVMKLFMQEMLACGIQMRLITEDNIRQMESMSFSHNLALLMKTDPQTQVQELMPKIKKSIQATQKYQMPLEDMSPPGLVSKNLLEEKEEETVPISSTSPDFPQHSFAPLEEESPPFNPGTPIQESPPYFQENNSSVPSFDISPPLEETTLPETEPSIQPSTGGEVYQTGGIVHFRGDNKPSRLWKIKSMGNQFMTIDTQDLEFISKADIPKIVTQADIYPPSYQYSQAYQTGGLIQAQPIPVPSYVPSFLQNQSMDQKQGTTVINIGGAKLVSGDDHSKNIQETPTSSVGGEKSVSWKEKENDNFDTKNETTGGNIDFTNQLVIKKLE